MEFIKEIISDLNKRGIIAFDCSNIDSEFCQWCYRNDFIPWRIRDEIHEFENTLEGQEFIQSLPLPRITA